LADALRQAQPVAPDLPTYHGYGRPEEAAAIDWILVSRHFRVEEAQVDIWRDGQRFPSDHYPVTAKLAWGP
jgi:endonuclease/exonuclease/phosphatase family metal-dependent hydrolase